MRSLVSSILGGLVLIVPLAAHAAQPAPAAAPSAPTDATATASNPAPSSPPPAAAKSEKLESPPKEEPKDEDHVAYISISPFHLLAPIVELTGEFRLHRKIGVAVIGAYGSIKVDGIADRFSAYEVGGQFVGYPVGHFDHGMQLGVETLFAGLSGSTSAGSERISGEGQGLSVGTFVGYKFASKVGFSLNVQGGISYLAARAQASAPSAGTATATASQWAPLLNFNLGWSF